MHKVAGLPYLVANDLDGPVIQVPPQVAVYLGKRCGGIISWAIDAERSGREKR